jgi:acyl carrier protein
MERKVDETLEKVLAVLESELSGPFTETSDLDKLDLDSLEFISLVTSIENALGVKIPDEQVIYMHTPADIVRIVSAVLPS